MATKIIHKKSSTASSVPVEGDLEPGELAVNLADKKLYTKTVGGTIIELGGGGPVNVNTRTASYTLALTDAEDIVEMNVASANVLTIPTNAAVAYPVGTIISVTMLGAGATTITADTGVTLNGNAAGSEAMSSAFDGVSIYQRATDDWVIQGAIGDAASMTDAEVKTAYENNADTNAFNDAAVTKLAGIDTAAKDDQTGAEIKAAYEVETNAFTDAQFTKLTGIETNATDDQSNAEIRAAVAAATDSNVFQDADASKLDGIDTAAKDDQTGAEIKTLYQGETNAFTDTQFTKLAGIDTGAKDDQTGAEIKTLYQSEANAYTDTKNTKLGTIEGSATADQTDGEIETAYNNQVAKVSGGEITAGTEVTVRRFSPDDIEAMVVAHAPGSSTEINTQVASYTLALTDAEDIVEMNVAGANALTIPLNATVAFPIPTIISVSLINAGETTVTAVAGVLLNGVDGGTAVMDSIYAGASLYKRATDEWVVQGAIDVPVFNSTDFAKVDGSQPFTATQGGITPVDNADLATKLYVDDAVPTNAEIRTAVEAATDSNVFTDNDHTKLDGIDTGAKDDQTNAEIRTAVGAATDSNVFTDSQQTSLGTMEDNAKDDQTDAEIETAYNAQVAQISGGEITAGTEVAVRRFSPDDVEAMIAVHAGGLTVHAGLTMTGSFQEWTDIPAGVSRIILAQFEVSVSSGSHMLVQLGDSVGYKTSGYVSRSSTTGTATSSTIGFVQYHNSGSRDVSGIMVLHRIGGTNTWSSGHTGDTTADNIMGGGHVTLDGELTRIKYTKTGGGNFDKGSIGLTSN